MGVRSFSVNFLQGLKQLGYLSLRSGKRRTRSALQRRAVALRSVARRMELSRRPVRLDPILQHKLELLHNQP